MECPKCKAKVGIMRHLLMVETGAIHCIKCYICGYWLQTDHSQSRTSMPTLGCPSA